MPSLKQIRRRLRSVRNTKLITRAMRSVSASKMRRAQDSRTKAKPYSDHLRELLARVLANVGLEDQPLAQVRPVGKRLVVVFSSDRGLCGAFNSTLVRFAEKYLNSKSDAENHLYIIGKRAGDYFRKRGAKIIKTQVDFRGNIDVPRTLEIAREIRGLFEDGSFDEIDLIHNSVVSAMAYRPIEELLLPLKADELVQQKEGGSNKAQYASDYIFEPDVKSVLSDLLPKYVENKVLFALMDSFTAEHQARMMAMSTANENCVELIDSLTLQINKARQASITKEILEIVGGAEALKG